MSINSTDIQWMAMFSRTGYELAEIIKRTNILPNRIITNSSNICSELKDVIEKNKIDIIKAEKKPTIDQYREYLNLEGKKTVTLHGWMRVIPPEICHEYEIFNGHPGLITRYPELKGKDPQEKAVKLGHFHIGTVIHRVIPVVDSGEILASSSIVNTYKDVETVSEVLREMSIALWCDILVENFKK